MLTHVYGRWTVRGWDQQGKNLLKFGFYPLHPYLTAVGYMTKERQALHTATYCWMAP